MVMQLVEHERGPPSIPVTGEYGWTTEIIQGAQKTARTTDIVRQTGETGRPALHSACSKGLRDIAEYLLKTGADVDALDRDGDTALLVAIVRVDNSLVNLLLSCKANPNAVAGAKTSSDKGRTALHKAASHNEASKIVHMILGAKAYVDPLDHYGETPLHDAARYGHDLAVKMLLEKGAIPDTQSRTKWTPLHLAASRGHKGSVEELLKSGALTTFRTKDGDTPESLAGKKSHDAVVKLLHQRDLLGQSYFGRNQKVIEPSEDQEPLCKRFQGMVWPHIGHSHQLFGSSVMEMLYGVPENLERSPMLEQLRNRGQASWIHLPANNRVWVEDVFKIIYHTPETTTTTNTGKDDKDKGKETLQVVKLPNVLSKILQFIKAQFNKLSQITHSRQPHFQSAQEPNPRVREDHIISLVLPIINTNIQQPRFYTPGSNNKLSIYKIGLA